MVVALDLVALDHLYLGMGPLMRGADRIMDTTSINIMKDGIIGILRGRRIIRIDQGEGVRRQVVAVTVRGGMGVAMTDTSGIYCGVCDLCDVMITMSFCKFCLMF